MASDSRRRDVVIKEDFSTDTILVILVGELYRWFQAAELAEEELAMLAEMPVDTATRVRFENARENLVKLPSDWIDLHAADKAPEADVPELMKNIRKMLQRIDFFLMPDRTLPDEQQFNGVRAKVRVQREHVGDALDRLADIIRAMVS